MRCAFLLTIFLALTCTSTALAQAPDAAALAKQAKEDLALAEEYIDHYRHARGAELQRFYTAATVWEDPAYKVELRGGEAILKELLPQLEDLTVDHFEVKERFASPRGVVILLFDVQGSLPGPQGRRRFDAPVLVRLKVADGKVLLHQDYPDYTCFAMQSEAQASGELTYDDLPACPD
ncbi:MAG: nuclear transport factor 2 family protein [Acidobacteriota bacterium]